VSHAQLAPAFGRADLSNCEREQIHLAGSIQPHGALLMVREPDLTVLLASENAGDFLRLTNAVIGQRLQDFAPDLAARVRPHLRDPLREVPRGIRCHIGNPPVAYDSLVHRPPNPGTPGGAVIIELEAAGPSVDLSQHLDRGLPAIMAAASLGAICDEAANLFKGLTGYDRVMVYRFDDQGHGEVFSEQREPSLEAFLGNHYPASDIPQIARQLYERNRVRVLVDVDFDPVPLLPMRTEQLDMSMCFLRSSSPIHVQYLKNMGVRATLVVSLMVSGRLWGLVSCHHYAPRFVHFEMRALCELLAEAIATRIAALESFAQAQAELSVRRLEQRMIRAISREGDWRGALFDRSKALLEPVSATGAVLLFDGEVRTVGEVPATPALRELGRWLDEQSRNGLVATACLGEEAPQFANMRSVASGVLAVPVSTLPGEYLIWMRPERVHTITWGGNPFKPSLVDDDLLTLSPRRSFAQWHQLVEGTADPWTRADLAAARLTADTLSDVIIQFRAVRMLFAEDQLAKVRRQVENAGQPLVVADRQGRILKINSAFMALLPPLTAPPEQVSDLLPLFTEPAEVNHRLSELLEQRRPWRGEVGIIGRHQTPTPLLVRADPVFTGPDRTLGFVLLCTDLTERREAEAARRRFQEGVIEQRRPISGQLDPTADLVFRNHISAIVENAQLAALEIADRVDPAQMPEMLEAVRASVARTAEVLRYLVWHASGAEGDRQADERQ
jgi:light-regulated signal transduction histidine kinase (bacteriophytochrome)